MFRYIIRKLLYGLLVMAGVVVLVFFLFQGFGDPSRLIMGQRADAATQENIRKAYSTRIFSGVDHGLAV